MRRGVEGCRKHPETLRQVDVGLTMESWAKRCQGKSKKGKTGQILYFPRSSDAPRIPLWGVQADSNLCSVPRREIWGLCDLGTLWGRCRFGTGSLHPPQRGVGGGSANPVCVLRSSADGLLVCPALGSDGSFSDPWCGCGGGGGVTL